MSRPERRLALSLCSFIFSLLLVEGFLEVRNYRDQRLKAEEDPYAWSLVDQTGAPLSKQRGPLRLVHESLLGFRFFPNQQTATFSINELGLRGKELPRNPKPSLRIVLLGGSTAFGVGAESDQLTFGEQLELELGDSEVINAAVIAYNSAQELGALMFITPELKPDLVLSLDGWNDFFQSQSRIGGSSEIDRQIERQLQIAYRSVHPNPLVRLVQISEAILFPALSTQLKMVLQGESALVVPWFGTVYEPETHCVMPLRANDYIENTRKIALVSKALGAKFVNFMQPDRNAWLLERGFMLENEAQKYACLFRGYNEFRRVVKSSFETSGISSFDFGNMGEIFPKDHFLDSIHLSGQGYHVLAQVAAQFLREQGIVRSS